MSSEIETFLSRPGTNNHRQDPQSPKTNKCVIHRFSPYVF